MDLLGHHFFEETTPVFNLDTTPEHQAGIAFTKVQKKIDAPSGSEQGENGAVEWLYLSTTDGTEGNFKSCENAPKEITVQYAANYYFFEDS